MSRLCEHKGVNCDLEPWSGEGAGEGTLGDTDAETEVGTAGKGTVGGFRIVSGLTFEYGIHFHQNILSCSLVCCRLVMTIKYFIFQDSFSEDCCLQF